MGGRLLHVSLGLVLLAGLPALSGCKSKKDQPPPEIPVGTAATLSAPPTPPPPPTVLPSASPEVSAAAKPANHVADASEIRACCAALRKEATGTNKTTYETATKTCDAIADLVLKGTTRHDAALTSLRAAVRGGKLPANCH